MYLKRQDGGKSTSKQTNLIVNSIAYKREGMDKFTNSFTPINMEEKMFITKHYMSRKK